MSILIAVMDRAGFEANTDILVLVQPEMRRLLWIPRDLWCATLNDRINVAFARGGHDLLVKALAEHKLPVSATLCLSREATEAALASAAVLVPVPVRMEFSYPLSPTAPIEEGSKQIVFTPPAELLRGERIHQWIGARGGSDLHRIERQKILARRLLEQRFDFSACLASPGWYRLSGEDALAELAQVSPAWEFQTLGGLQPAIIDDKQVLLRAGSQNHSF